MAPRWNGRSARSARDRTGRFGLVRLWAETVAGLLRTGPREHLAQLRQDSVYALRVMRRSPGFTAVTVLTLAVGIGATSAIFSLVDAVLLKPLPYPAPERLVRIYERKVSDNLLHNSASAPNVLDWQQQTTAFAQIAAYRTRSANVPGRGDPRVVVAARGSANVFSVLGVQPALGRTLSEAEDRQGAPLIVIGDALGGRSLARSGGDRPAARARRRGLHRRRRAAARLPVQRRRRRVDAAWHLPGHRAQLRAARTTWP